MPSVKDRRGGMYWVNGKPLISVTNILQVIDKPALRHWYGQQVYYEVVKNPCIDEREALAAPYKASRSAADRGSSVHSLIEAYKRTGKVIEMPSELDGYAKAFYRWIEDMKPSIIENEKTVMCSKLGYAGTLDMVAAVGSKKHVIDFKTNKDGSIYDEAHMQVSAYLNCDNMQGFDGGFIVALAPDGTYQQQVCRNGYRAFLSAMDLYVFMNYAKLKKLGWSRGE